MSKAEGKLFYDGRGLEYIVTVKREKGEISKAKFCRKRRFNESNVIAIYNFPRLRNYQSRRSLWPDRKTENGPESSPRINMRYLPRPPPPVGSLEITTRKVEGAARR